MNYETNITGETKHSIASDIELDDGYERSNKTRWIIGGIILLIGALAGPVSQRGKDGCSAAAHARALQRGVLYARVVYKPQGGKVPRLCPRLCVPRRVRPQALSTRRPLTSPRRGGPFQSSARSWTRFQAPSYRSTPHLLKDARRRAASSRARARTWTRSPGGACGIPGSALSR